MTSPRHSFDPTSPDLPAGTLGVDVHDSPPSGDLVMSDNTTVSDDLVKTNADRLVDYLAALDRIVVAFSGGVDSSVVAAAAQQVALKRGTSRDGKSGPSDQQDVIAVTARSASVATWQLQTAQRVASEIGIAHQVVDTNETSRQEYIANDSKRCFYCKQTLYQTLGTLVSQFGLRGESGNVSLGNVSLGNVSSGKAAQNARPQEIPATIVSGTNADDLGDYRPGIEAGLASKVVTPLADLGFGKTMVRNLAAYFGLSNADLPASPCLASRIAYGVPVTHDRLQRVEKAEATLRRMGFSDIRVRLHENELARIEVPLDQISRCFDQDIRTTLDSELRRLGFQYVTVDLFGLQSGSMNLPLVNIAGTAK